MKHSNMEPLSGAKFAELNKEQQLLIKGGIETPGRTVIAYYRLKTSADGLHQFRQPVYHSYSKDDIDGKDKCYWDEEYCDGEWEQTA